MKNTTSFIIELLITVVVAFLLSALAVLILSFVLANLGSYRGSESNISYVGGIIFGLVVGYKLHSLITQHKK